MAMTKEGMAQALYDATVTSYVSSHLPPGTTLPLQVVEYTMDYYLRLSEAVIKYVRENAEVVNNRVT